MPTLSDVMTGLRKRLRAMLRPAAAEQEMTEEHRFHLEMEARKLEARGLTSEQAARAARIAFGGVEQTREAVREGRGFPVLAEAARDFRFTLLSFRRTPGFAIVAVATLAMGIGAATSIFALVDAVILRDLPYHDSARLVHVWETNPDGNDFSVSESNYLDFKQRTTSLEVLGAYRNDQLGLTGRGEPQLLSAASGSASLFAALRVNAELGRVFGEDEDLPGAPARVVVLSHALWQGPFDGDSVVVGQTAVLGGEPYTIIGVLPSSFRLVGAEAWVPLGADPHHDRDDHWLGMIGRLKPGVSPEQVSAELAGITAANAAIHPEVTGWGARALPLAEWAVGTDLRRTGTLLAVAVAVLLLLACANVANLLLARATARETEMAIRIAMGAGRGRLIRQLLVESGTLAVLGAAAGLIGVRWIVLAAKGLPAGVIPGLEGLSISPRVVAFSLGATLLTTLVAGLAPALRASSVDLHSTLKRAGRAGASPAAHRLREFLVGAQVALAVLLLMGGGLMIQSVVRLGSADIGIASTHVWTVPLSPSPSRYQEQWQLARFFNVVSGRIAELPGIVAVGATAVAPFSGFNLVNDVTPEDQAEQYPAGGFLQAAWRVVSLDYFEAAGIPLLLGRNFTEEDMSSGIRVAMVTRSMAERLWPGQDAVGKRFFWGGVDGTPRTVIGVVGDISDVQVEQEPMPTMFLSTRQMVWPSMALVVRADRAMPEIAEQVRRAVWAEDPTLPVPVVRSMTESRDRATATPRLSATIIGLFAGAAVTLALVGLYGVLSYAVVERTREIGIRIALGARPRLVVRQLVGRGLRLASAGIVAGLAGGLLLAPLMRSLLFRTTPTDPLVLVGVPLALLLAAALAAFVPARRAARVDPVTAFRSE